MILVTGTKRSGTSMWMQILKAAGFPIIGTAFPSHWERSIQAANPRGFYESGFRRGVYYATNPDPRTGAFIAPGPSRDHVVKVFIPGLIRTDLAYVHRVLATLRDWRAYGPSVRRLYALEDEWLRTRPLRPDEPEEARAANAERVLRARGTLPPAIEWWLENYDLVRDVATRRYPFHLVTYDRLRADPGAEIHKVIGWLGSGDLDAAVAVVTAQVEREPVREDEGIDGETAAFFDELYAGIHATGALSKAVVDQMNVVQHRILERYSGTRRDADADAPGA